MFFLTVVWAYEHLLNFLKQTSWPLLQISTYTRNGLRTAESPSWALFRCLPIVPRTFLTDTRRNRVPESSWASTWRSDWSAAAPPHTGVDFVTRWFTASPEKLIMPRVEGPFAALKTSGRGHNRVWWRSVRPKKCYRYHILYIYEELEFTVVLVFKLLGCPSWKCVSSNRGSSNGVRFVVFMGAIYWCFLR